jgi:hypothetical protein
MPAAAFNTGSDTHLLDHIAPLAALHSMPLITTEELNTHLAKRFYPQVILRYMPDLEFKLKEIAEEFDTLYECKYWAPHLKLLFRQLYNKEMELIFCPHGQSDKGYQAPLLAPYATQSKVLIYGQLMKTMLKELKVPLPKHELIGNYRLSFYQKHQSFYDALAEEQIFSKLPSQNRTVLYAPTWRDADQASSFFSYCKPLISQLPQDWNLLIKLHPLLEQRDPAQFYSIATLIAEKPNALIVQEFPPVYPILSKADVYLGDASSVGYDYLTFERPMFFFPASRARLHSCGIIIDPTRNIYTQMEKQNSFASAQQKLYKLAFAK